MTSQLGLQTVPVHMLPNISQSKGNQTMEFWSSNRTYITRAIFSSKIMYKIRQGDWF